MKKRIFQCYDLVAEMTVGPIMIHSNEKPAIRDFTTVLADKNTNLGIHPADYELRELGTIDEATAVIEQPDGFPKVVATGAQWLAEQERQLTIQQ